MSEYKVTAKVQESKIRKLEKILSRHCLQLRGRHGVAGFIYDKLMNEALDKILDSYEDQEALLQEIYEQTEKGDF